MERVVIDSTREEYILLEAVASNSGEFVADGYEDSFRNGRDNVGHAAVYGFRKAFSAGHEAVA